MDKDIQTSCPAADPQPVVQSAGMAAIFIVLSLADHDDAADTVRDALGEVPAMLRTLNLRLPSAALSCVIGIGHDAFYWYLYITIVAIITAILVASCGIIGFVGLITPYLARSLVGSNYKKIFPIASLFGVFFILWADVFARVLIKNAELLIGIFIALVGAPFFIYMVTKSRKEALS